MYFPQLPELADFANAVPEPDHYSQSHIGGLLRVGPYANRDDEVLATWRNGIAAVAECPNINVKLGGIGMPRTGFDWHARDNTRRLGRARIGYGAPDELLYRAVRPGPVYVREQLPGG